MNELVLFLLTFVLPIAIQAREAIRPQPEVGQIIKDLTELHLEEVNERGDPCVLDIQKDLSRSGEAQPLYLHPHKDIYWLPNAKGQLEIPRGASIELYCSHSFSNISPAFRSIHARCLHDTTFEWSGGKRELRNFACTQQLKYSVQRLEEPCGDGDTNSTARIYRVGYNIDDGRFVRTLELCHDAEQLRTHYAFYQLLPANEHFQRQVQRVKFSPAGHFTGYDMERLYTQKYQQRRVAELLQAAAVAGQLDSDSLFNKNAGLFLARGHLAAKADLIYANQQRSSFNYLNAAPQWQSFNGGHWANVEDKTRRFVSRSGLSVSVYTGTYGVMPLPDSAQTSFHLASDANNNGVVAVPLLYYRVLIDNDRPWRGVALLGVNNPHATLQQILEKYVICEPVEPQLLPWLHWLQKTDKKQLKKGYVYACRVSDFAEVVKHLPPQLQEVCELLV